MVYVIGIVAALIILFGFLCYKKAPPTEAIVVTGFGLSKPKVVCGKGTFVLPVLQRADRLNMRLLKIDVKTPETGVKTKNGVSLWIDSVVTIQVYSENSTVLDEEVKASGLKDAKAYIMSRQQAAISNFLGMNEQGINEKVNDVLQGNLREIVSDMTVDQILTNRKQMAVSVIENARPDLAKMGLEVVTFNVQDIRDAVDVQGHNHGVIEAIGIEQEELVKKQAEIARAQAARDVACAKADAEMAANAKEVEAQTAIAKRNNELQLAKAKLKAEADKAAADADAAGQIQMNLRAKEIKEAEADAEIAKQKKMVDLAAQEAEVQQRKLDAEVRKQADADLYRRQKEAEAKKYEAERAAEAVKQLPKLHIDYDAGTMTFNDENINLNPNLSEVAKNIKSIQKFFSGMDYFYGDVEQAKKDYFKYMTWYLATPFMAYLRYFASRNNYDTKLFPMYGVIYGDSNGGKTTFIKFLVKLMCGETVKMNTTEDFTATRIDGLKRVCEGLPLNIDDLAKTQFQNHSERVIKNDEWGISDRLVNYPAVSITSNKITSLTKDLSKRAIICRIGAKIDNERGAKNSKRVNESMSELTTAFYGEYVRRMLVCIDEMTTEMRENANGKEYFPDIFHASSSVIADIFKACGIDLPDYVRILYYNDYMGDESIGRAAIEKIELAWQADPSKFRVDKKQNRLIYSYPPDGPWYELKYIADELPNSLEAEISGGNQLIMNYEQAQELFGIKFRRWLGIFNL